MPKRKSELLEKPIRYLCNCGRELSVSGKIVLETATVITFWPCPRCIDRAIDNHVRGALA